MVCRAVAAQPDGRPRLPPDGHRGLRRPWSAGRGAAVPAADRTGDDEYDNEYALMMMLMMVWEGVPAAVLRVPGRHRPPPAAVASARHAGQLLPRRDDPAGGQPRRPHSAAAAQAKEAVNGILAVAVTDSVVTLVMTQVENSDDLRWCSECEQDVRKTEERIFIAWESVLLLASPFLG